jgi:hypothetical protein
VAGPPKPLPAEVREAAEIIFQYGAELALTGEKRNCWYLLEHLLPGHFFEALGIAKPRPFVARRTRPSIPQNSLEFLTATQRSSYREATVELCTVKAEQEALRHREAKAKATQCLLLELAEIGTLQAEIDTRKRRLGTPSGTAAVKKEYTETAGNTVAARTPSHQHSIFGPSSPTVPTPPKVPKTPLSSRSVEISWADIKPNYRV